MGFIEKNSFFPTLFIGLDRALKLFKITFLPTNQDIATPYALSLEWRDLLSYPQKSEKTKELISCTGEN